MADEQVDVSTDEGATDNADNSTIGKVGFFKSKLFKIILAVILVIIIAGGAYFFLAPTKEIEPDSVSEEAGLENDIDSPSVELELEAGIANEEELTTPSDELLETSLDSNDTEFIEAINETKKTDSTTSELDSNTINPELDAEKQRLEAELIATQQKSAALAEENRRMQQQLNELKAQISQKEKLLPQKTDYNRSSPIQNPNSVDYQQDFFDNSLIRQSNRPSSPPPKPSWGEFNRINKNK